MVGVIPWWILAVIILIFVSGYMAFRTMVAERRLDEQFIEREGRIYMDRMEEEKQRKAARRRELSN